MSVKNSKNLNLLLIVVFVLTFAFVKSLRDVRKSGDLKYEEFSAVEQLVTMTRTLSYMIMPFDEYTGQVGASPFETQYRDYDACLVALFDKRANMALVKTQYKMSIKCEQPTI